MSKLDYITVRGFKSIESIEKMEIGPLTVVIGPNGSGKTNFVGVFSFLNAVREGRLREYILKAGGADRVLHFGTGVTKELYIRVSFGNEVNQYEMQLGSNGADGLVPLYESVYFWDKRRYSSPYEEGITGTSSWEAAISRPDLCRTARHVRQHLASWRLYHFHDTSGHITPEEDGRRERQPPSPPRRRQPGTFPPSATRKAQGFLPFHRGDDSASRAFLPGLLARTPAPEPRQDQARVEARRNGRLLRCITAVGWHAALHGAGDPVSPADGVQAIGHRGRRTRAGYAPFRRYAASGTHEAGGDRFPGDRLHPIVPSVGPLRAGGGTGG